MLVLVLIQGRTTSGRQTGRGRAEGALMLLFTTRGGEQTTAGPTVY